VTVAGNSNLFLLPGHIGIAEYETTLGIAQELSGSLLALRNLPGSIRFLIDATAASVHADYVLVDMSPSLGPLNQNIFSTSDFFLVPLHPDYFSAMALSSLSKALPRWKSWAETAFGVDALANADYPFPKPNAQYIGSIIQKYRPRNGRASSAFQRWIDQLINGLKDTLVPALAGAHMLNVDDYQNRSKLEPWIPILEMGDFNGLIAYSQEHQVPVYALTPELINQRGAIWTQTKTDMDRFEGLFKKCANTVFALTE
jgi:cellulose biosynthesis protein BcsQ